MSRKINYRFDISATQSIYDIAPSLIQAVKMPEDAFATISTSLINRQFLETTQPMKEVAEKMNQILNSSGVAESINRIYEVIGENIAIQNALKPLSLHSSVVNSFKDLNLDIDSTILKTMQDIKINISGVEETIQNNLRLFREIDWSEIIELEELEDFSIEKALDEVVVDINDGITLHQRLMEFIEELKMKYPLIFIVFMMFVCSPIQSAVDDAVLNAIKGTTTPLIEQAQTTNYKAIDKNIRVEVNNTLNIIIESKDSRDEYFNIYGYVSTDTLIMRQSNKVKSRALHTLKFGQVVKIIHKNRNWTLVEYEKDEDVIRGWVFTRYISKFKK